MLYRQCKLERENKVWMAWIPLKLAKVGLPVIPKGEEQAVVKEVYRMTKTHKQVRHLQKRKWLTECWGYGEWNW